MGAKFSKIASIKTATECSVAFSRLLKTIKQNAKEYEPHANYQSCLNRMYHTCRMVLDVFRLQHSFYPLAREDFMILVDDYYDAKVDCCIMACNCMNPIIKRLPKLDMANCELLLHRMNQHLHQLFKDLGYQFGLLVE